MADVRRGAEALPQVPLVEMSAESVATDISRQGTAIGNTQVAQNRSLPPAEWTGQAADAASAEIQSLGDKTVTLSQAFSPAATALNTWAEDVRSACSDITKFQEEWDAAVAEYNDVEATSASTTGTHGSGSVSHPDGNLAVAGSILSSKQMGILERYKKRVNDLDDRADAAAQSVNTARKTIVSDEAGSRGRGAIGVELFKSDTPILNAAAQWADAQAMAPEIAEAIKKQPLTAADVNDFNSKYGKYLDNPYYAAAIAQHVSVDDLNKAVLAAMQAGYDRKTGYLISDGYETFNKNMGSLMVMATGGSNLAEKMADTQKSFDMFSQGFLGKNGVTVQQIFTDKLAQLQESGWSKYEHPKIGANASTTLYGYDIFTQLAGAAARDNTSLALGPGFYDTGDGKGASVFSDIVKWDHQMQMGVTGTDSMAQRASQYALFGLAGNEKLTHEQFKSVFDPVQSVLELSDRPDNLDLKDQSVLAQHEETRMRAIRSAMSADTNFDVNGNKMNLTRYLTGWRGNAAGGGAAYQDLGNALGDLVNDASQHNAQLMDAPDATKYPLGLEDPQYKADQAAYDHWSVDEVNRAKIAQNFMLGYQDGLDHNSWTSGGEDAFGHSNSKMRSWMGSVVAPRVSELADMLMDTEGEGGNNNVRDEARKHHMLDLSNQDLKRMFSKSGLFTDLTHDQPTHTSGDGTKDEHYEGGRRPAWSAINSEAWKEYRLELKRQVNAEYGPTWASDVAKNTAGWQTLINGLDEAPVNAKLAEDNDMVARNKVIRGMIDYAVDKVPLSEAVPVGGSEFTGAVKSSASAILDKYLPTDLSAADVARRIEQEEHTSTAVKDAVNEAFLARGGALAGADKTKAELDRMFLASNGAGQGLNSQAAQMPPVSELTADQRKAYFEFLGGSTDDATINGKKVYTGDKTALGMLQHDVNQEIATGEAFLKDAKEHYSK